MGSGEGWLLEPDGGGAAGGDPFLWLKAVAPWRPGESLTCAGVSVLTCKVRGCRAHLPVPFPGSHGHEVTSAVAASLTTWLSCCRCGR